MATTNPSVVDRDQPATLSAAWHTRLIGVLEEQPWLADTERTVSRWLQPAVDWAGRTGLKDWLHGVPLGHALHPILVDLPIGFWTSAWLLDLIGLRRSARVLTAAGCASAVGAAASGVADWSATDGRERRLGALHGMLNLAGLTFQTAALLSRRRYRRYSYLGYAFSTAAAYLGGELVFGRGVMVDHDAWTAGPDDWTPVARLTDIEDGGIKAVEVAGRQVLLYRQGERVTAMEDACAHLGGPLHEGEVKDGCVTCPWHGSQFRLGDGMVIRGPATFAQKRLESRLQTGKVEVRGLPTG